MFLELIEALIKAALPVGGLGYLLVYWSIRSGRLSAGGDARALRAELKTMKAERKAAAKAAKAGRRAARKAARADAKAAAGTAAPLWSRIGRKMLAGLKPTGNPVHDKWMKFGGGFYGVVALWTYVVIESQEAYRFLVDFSGLSGLVDRFDIGLVVEFLVNSVMNFVIAILWFGYWPDVLRSEWLWLWLAVAYGGYLGGVELARRRWPARLWE